MRKLSKNTKKNKGGLKYDLVVAIFAGLWFWFASGCWGYTFHYVLKQPLVMALPFGILMGDIPTAMIIGATIELVYVGMISPGANIPADECFAGVISIPLALLAGAKPETSRGSGSSVWPFGNIP